LFRDILTDLCFSTLVTAVLFRDRPRGPSMLSRNDEVLSEVSELSSFWSSSLAGSDGMTISRSYEAGVLWPFGSNDAVCSKKRDPILGTYLSSSTIMTIQTPIEPSAANKGTEEIHLGRPSLSLGVSH
jgi:hypothetical protein